MYGQFWNCRPQAARGRWGWDASFMSGFFGPEGRPRGRWRGGRLFEQGDLRYVILRLLDEKPRHGYEITDAGRAHLKENQDTVDSIFERISKLVGHFLDEPMTAVHSAFRGVGKATYSRATDAVQNPEVLRRIVEILERATKEIDAIPR